jgi:hypothetical protein
VGREDLDVIPLELMPRHVDLVVDDLLHAGEQVGVVIFFDQ